MTERLDDAHRRTLEDHWHAIRAVARSFSAAYRDDEFESFVPEYLCLKATRFDPSRGSPRGWAIRQAEFACREYLDSRRRKRIPIDLDHPPPDRLAGRADEPGADMESREECDRLLGALTPRERWVVERSVIDEFRMAEIGAMLGITESGASRIKLRAFAKVRAAS